MSLILVGFLEMLIVTVWTKTVSETQVVASGVATLVHVMVWYYVIQRLMTDINNWQIALMYAIGCALGTVITTQYYKYKQTTQVATEK
ncbi:hypothetical protein IT409_00805 [Candidatus Falkowbacteria bacterium]|nr:hypothetical protein [Candidatus Falkowbacteria bacterium]